MYRYYGFNTVILPNSISTFNCRLKSHDVETIIEASSSRPEKFHQTLRYAEWGFLRACGPSSMLEDSNGPKMNPRHISITNTATLADQRNLSNRRDRRVQVIDFSETL